MKILQIIDNKTTYHKEIEKALKDNHEIITYSISYDTEYETLNMSIDTYETINNVFDYIFIYAFPKQNSEYYLMIKKYLTIKKILFIDFVSESSLFSNILSVNSIKRLIEYSEKTFIFNDKIYNILSKNNDKCIKLNYFKTFDNTNNFINYEDKNNKDVILNYKNDEKILNDYNLHKLKSSSILNNIIHNDEDITYIDHSDINKMFLCLYKNSILDKELLNFIYNGIIIFVNFNYANKIYINNQQKLLDTNCCIIYNSLEDLIIKINKISNSSNTYNSIRNNTFNVFKQISNLEIKKISSILS